MGVVTRAYPLVLSIASVRRVPIFCGEPSYPATALTPTIATTNPSAVHDG
jgi:hypothetical protein